MVLVWIGAILPASFGVFGSGAIGFIPPAGGVGMGVGLMAVEDGTGRGFGMSALTSRAPMPGCGSTATATGWPCSVARIDC